MERPFGRPEERYQAAAARGSGMAGADTVGPDEELVAGRRPVEEVFTAGRPARRLLVVPQRRQALERIVLHATNLRIPIVEIEGGTLTSLAGFDGHQGVAVVVEPRRYATLEDILARAIELDEPPFVLALDSLEDPHNVGTLLRSAEAAGAHGVIFPTHRQAPLSPSAVKASAGAVEHLLLCPVDDLAAALADLHIRGLRVAGAEADAPLTAREADLRGGLAIVVGSEGQGLGPAVRRRCDVLMRIPMRGSIDSLNAAVAGSILLFEALAQRDPNATPRPRPPRPLVGAHPRDAADATPPAEGTMPAQAGTDDGGDGAAPVGSGSGADTDDSGITPTTTAGVAESPADGGGADPEGAEAAPQGPAAGTPPRGTRARRTQATAEPAVPAIADAAAATRPPRRRTKAAGDPADAAVVEPVTDAVAPATTEAEPPRRPRRSRASPDAEATGAVDDRAMVDGPAAGDGPAADDRPEPRRARRSRALKADATDVIPEGEQQPPPDGQGATDAAPVTTTRTRRRTGRSGGTPDEPATRQDEDDDLLPGGPLDDNPG